MARWTLAVILSVTDIFVVYVHRKSLVQYYLYKGKEGKLNGGRIAAINGAQALVSKRSFDDSYFFRLAH